MKEARKYERRSSGSSRNSYSLDGAQPRTSWTYGKASIKPFSKARRSLIHVSCQKVKVGPGGPPSSPQADSTDQKLLIFYSTWIIAGKIFFPLKSFADLARARFPRKRQSSARSHSYFKNRQTGPYNSWRLRPFKERERNGKKRKFCKLSLHSYFSLHRV